MSLQAAGVTSKDATIEASRSLYCSWDQGVECAWAGEERACLTEHSPLTVWTFVLRFNLLGQPIQVKDRHTSAG